MRWPGEREGNINMNLGTPIFGNLARGATEKIGRGVQ